MAAAADIRPGETSRYDREAGPPISDDGELGQPLPGFRRIRDLRGMTSTSHTIPPDRPARRIMVRARFVGRVLAPER